MIRKKKFFTILICLVGFLACSALQYAHNWNNDLMVEIDFSGEEESESSEKETENKELTQQYNFALFDFQSNVKTELHAYYLVNEVGFIEVSTPPPRFT